MTAYPHRGMAAFLCLAATIMLSVPVVQGDYNVGFVLSHFSHPSNTLFNNTCCDPTNCSDCEVTLRICFRESQHPQSDTDSDCPIFQLNRIYATFFSMYGTDHSPTEGPYPGEFQVYIRVSHSRDPNNGNFDPPFSDALIDDIFVEVSLPAASYENRDSPVTEMYPVEGVYGKASLQIRVNVHCAEGYHGAKCDKTGSDEETEDSDGHTGDSHLEIADESGFRSEDESSSVVAIAVGSVIGAFVVVALLVIGIVVAVALKRSKRTIWKSKYTKWFPASEKSETNVYTTADTDIIENPTYSSSS